MANRDEHIAVRVGNWVVEYAIRQDGTMPAKDFVNSLDPSVKDRILAAFRHVAQTGGRGVPPQVFKHERDELWAFKCKHEKRRIRLPCFRRNNRWIVTHGFFKPPRSKWPEQEFTLAFLIRDDVVRRESPPKKR